MYPSMDQPIFNDTKYTQTYFAIIEKARQSPPSDYGEFHHVMPRSLGGTNAKSNIVKLSARQHFVCHLLLVKMTSGRAKRKMTFAAHHMSICHRRERYKISSITYESLKRQQADLMRGPLNPMYGKHQTWSPESRARLSSSLLASAAFKTGRGPEWRRKISEAQSREVIVINSVTNAVFGEWSNCTRVAEALGCTRAAIKTAVRNGTYVGRKLKSLNYVPHWVRWKDDVSAKPLVSLEELHEIRVQAGHKTWKKRRT